MKKKLITVVWKIVYKRVYGDPSFTGKYLFAKLNQDVIKFSHQVIVDGLSRSDVLEFEEHVKCSSGRAQRLKRVINQGDGLIFNILTRYIRDNSLTL